MTYPSNQEWAFMRAEVQKFMQDTVSIYNVTTSYTSENGETKVRSIVASGVKAQVYGASNQEKQMIAALVNVGTEVIETAKINLPHSQSLTMAQEIYHNSKYWNVVDVNTNQSYRAVTQALLYRKLVNDEEV